MARSPSWRVAAAGLEVAPSVTGFEVVIVGLISAGIEAAVAL